MKNKTRMMVSISILLIASISCQMVTDLLSSGGANPGSFTAEATSPVSVQLTWSSVEGAQKYLIERNDGETDYFPLGEIPGETISFEDFLVPSNTQVSYRIKTVTASGTSGGKTVSLTTPQEIPNPLTVAATFDTQNAQSQAIGPDGGSVSLTDSRGVRYTLDVPAGALDNEVTLTLTPIQDIQGLPLSGGMTSGVWIEPEGLVFNQSATLSIETAEADGTDEMIDMAFAFDGEGSEFHFVPGSSAAGTSAVFKLARPAYKSKMKWITVPQNKPYGSGKGTPKDIRDQVKNHAPSSPADNLNQKMAAGGDADLLTPLVDLKVVSAVDTILLYTGRELELQVADASDWLEFTIALDSFQAWLDTLDAQKNTLKKDQLDKREEAIWEALVNDAHALLEIAAKDCKKSPNLADAKKLVNQLLNGKSPFYRKFAEKFNQEYGADALKNIKAKLDKCKLASYEGKGKIRITEVADGGEFIDGYEFLITFRANADGTIVGEGVLQQVEASARLPLDTQCIGLEVSSLTFPPMKVTGTVKPDAMGQPDATFQLTIESPYSTTTSQWVCESPEDSWTFALPHKGFGLDNIEIAATDGAQANGEKRTEGIVSTWELQIHKQEIGYTNHQSAWSRLCRGGARRNPVYYLA